MTGVLPAPAGVASSRSAATGRGRNGLGRRIARNRWAYLFVAPMLILLVTFTLYPILASWGYSFYRWDGYGPLTDFLGFGNFVEAARDPAYWFAFRNTFAFSAVAVFVQVPLALLMALVLNNSHLRGRSIYRTLLFIPVVSTTAVIGVVFSVLLDTNGGPINQILMALGLDNPINFLGSPRTALLCVLAVDLWKGFGITLVYWLAALQTVPADIYDAARVDGANRRNTVVHIVVPMLRPFATVILLLTFISSFAAFDIVQTMTGGGPNGATDIVQTYIYRYAFNPAQFVPRYGFASAAALLFGIVVLVLTAIPMALVRRAQRHSAETEAAA